MAVPDQQIPIGDERRRLMTVSEAAAYCHVSYETFRRWIAKDVLPHVRVGPDRAIRVYRRDVEGLISTGR